MRVWPAKEVKKGHFKLTADVRAARAGRSRRASKDVRGTARGVDVSGSELSKSDSPKRGGVGEVGAGGKSGGGGKGGIGATLKRGCDSANEELNGGRNVGEGGVWRGGLEQSDKRLCDSSGDMLGMRCVGEDTTGGGMPLGKALGREPTRVRAIAGVGGVSNL
jgi:hypothetical protein